MSLKHTINLGNSIIGVSLLAMPYCFKSCGIALSIALVLASGLLNRAGCHLLLRSARSARCRTFHQLAFAVFGSAGKTFAEFSVVGFLLGTCVAFFVVIGDLGPALASQAFNLEQSPHLRAFIMTFLGMFVALPLGLLRRVDSFASFSAVALALYAFLALKLFFEAFERVAIVESNHFWQQINWWDSSHILTTLPIFVMSLSCQPQLFEIFESSTLLSEDYRAMPRLNRVVRSAVNICSLVYIAVGILGYLAFHDQHLHGNVLLALPSNLSSALAQAGFVFTIIISLPLCLFPCRSSLHSMLTHATSPSLLTEHALPNVYMSDRDFRTLTLFLIIITIGISILIPHIELILGLVGSTIGAFVCFILPALCFVRLIHKPPSELWLARLVLALGVFVLFVCTLSTLNVEVDTLEDESIPISKLDAQQIHNQPSSLGNLKPINSRIQINDAISAPRESLSTPLSSSSTSDVQLLGPDTQDKKKPKADSGIIVDNSSNIDSGLDKRKKKLSTLLQTNLTNSAESIPANASHASDPSKADQMLRSIKEQSNVVKSNNST